MLRLIWFLAGQCANPKFVSSDFVVALLIVRRVVPRVCNRTYFFRSYSCTMFLSSRTTFVCFFIAYGFITNQQNDLLSVDGALRRYRRGYGFNSSKSLIFFSGSIFTVHNTQIFFGTGSRSRNFKQGSRRLGESRILPFANPNMICLPRELIWI